MDSVTAPQPGVHFITGTDTGVGKTVFTVLLTRALLAAGISVAAVKPFCSGGRADARALHRALAGRLGLDEVNPWHFRPPITPLLAARRAGQRIPLAEVVGHIQRLAANADWTLVEGAGGLLSPLGEGYTARELIVALGATPWVVCANRLGALNQSLLTLAALPSASRKKARLILMAPRQNLACAASNRDLLREMLGSSRVIAIPHLRADQLHAPVPPVIRRLLPRGARGVRGSSQRRS